ncbi:hypothetical protein E2C01_032561 [Portunus trituberculatus]|uniref:Uncharacterized protein n=1 Tax=Portunus trituberculatus TaxID=210409 RepID=A0A5B7EXU7_PORTR|nr:hypothetical protein [Portunus trituberculatus]
MDGMNRDGIEDRSTRAAVIRQGGRQSCGEVLREARISTAEDERLKRLEEGPARIWSFYLQGEKITDQTLPFSLFSQMFLRVVLKIMAH